MRAGTTLTQRTRAALCAVLGGILAIVIMPSPASAADYNGACDYGEVCLWNDSYGDPPVADYYNDVSNYSGRTYYGSSTSLNDSASRVNNKANWQDVTVYEHASYGGAEYTICTHCVITDLGVLNNQTSSHYF